MARELNMTSKSTTKTKAKAQLRPMHGRIADEWYTPPSIIEAARHSMGSIDLDPASCAMANRVVKAKRYYSKRDNGLKQEWSGNVWCNPPFRKGQLRAWIDKSMEHTEPLCLLLPPSNNTHILYKVIPTADWMCWFIPKRDWYTPLHDQITLPMQIGFMMIAGYKCEPSPMWASVGVIR